jgi:hypothetical protein
MCDELTSSVLSVKEPFEVRCHNISSHSETWTALKLRDGACCPWRECGWPAGESKPTIRWRDEDDEDVRSRVMSWFLRRWPTVNKFVEYCVSRAVVIHADSATTLPKLPAGLTYLSANSATTLPKLPAGLTYLSAYSATNKNARLAERKLASGSAAEIARKEKP